MSRLRVLQRVSLVIIIAVLFGSGVCHSQARGDGVAVTTTIPVDHPEPGLRRGVNELGIWTGYSPFSFQLKGAIKDRQLFLLGLQYARALFATRPLTFKYTADAVPVAFEIQPTQRYVIDGQRLLTNPSGTIYGAGASPIGFQANFGPKRIQPCMNGSLGFLYFNRQVPVLGASQFNYTISVGFGTQIFLRPGRSFAVGWKYFHLSNNYQAHLNPGIDSGVFYAEFSAFRPKQHKRH